MSSLAFHCLEGAIFQDHMICHYSIFTYVYNKFIYLFICPCNPLFYFTCIYCRFPPATLSSYLKGPVIKCCPWDEDKSRSHSWQRLAMTRPSHISNLPRSDTHQSDDSARTSDEYTRGFSCIGKSSLPIMETMLITCVFLYMSCIICL